MGPRLKAVAELDLNSVLSSTAQAPRTGWGWEVGVAGADSRGEEHDKITQAANEVDSRVCDQFVSLACYSVTQVGLCLH